LLNLGFRAVNTGCPTLWILTEDHCKKIPCKKADTVIFTLTDYCRNEEQDKALISILRKNYKKLYFWIQGRKDLEYLLQLSDATDIELISPNLKAYHRILSQGNTDYVGTRLHAGIFAMRNFVRSIILIVDNRARDMKKDSNLIAIERDDIEKLDSLINSTIKTNIYLNKDSIDEFKSQFII
jgi:polysaccharide pyruvyl transferase WcaK-like protein